MLKENTKEEIFHYYCSLYNQSNIVLIGPYPPPFGGVSVHIQRLANLLKEFGKNVTILNLGKKGNLKYLNIFFKLVSHKKSIISIHSIDYKLSLVILVANIFRKLNLLLVVHNPRTDLFIKKTYRLSYLRLLKKAQVQFVRDNIKKDYLDNKFVSNNQNLSVFPAFIPPKTDNETIEESLLNFINSKEKVLLFYGVVHFRNNIDLYGIDMIVNVMESLVRKYPKIGMIVILGDHTKNSQYIKNLNKKHKTKNSILFVDGNIEMWPLYKRTDIFLRPTSSDGDAVSIREALFFNVKVIASNCVERPDGVILHKNRDVKDLYNKICSVIDSKI